MKAQQAIEDFKNLGLITSDKEPGCYKSSNREKMDNIFYHAVDDTIEIDGGHLFVFSDKSSIESDGTLFIVRDSIDTDYRLKQQ